jgi:membrane protein
VGVGAATRGDEHGRMGQPRLRPWRRLIDGPPQPPAGVRTRTARLVEWTQSSLPVRCAQRVRATNGRDRAFVLAGQAFTTVIPLLIVVGAAARHNGSSVVADRLDRRFHLGGTSAQALRALFERPPGATGAVTVASVVVMLFSLISLAHSLQRTFEAAWSLPSAGVRGTLHGLSGLGLLLTSVLLLSVIVAMVRPLPAGTVIATAVRTLVAAATWLVLQDLLLSRRIGIRRLVPGALVAGVGQTLISVYSGISMSHVIEHNAERYGVIGVTFALLSWLILIGLSFVVFAAVSAELGGARRV